ncbi:hypothetical protein VTN77DRAFT_5072 [Rasamsonia byssochlamydoides]|uniref:uncharacterized protein n=1 Tax=Rasamsonia byssochlamydoides TaxID=89139 RepID=UPI00374305C9
MGSYCEYDECPPSSSTTEERRKKQQKQQRPWIETPLVESAVLSRAAGCRIFLKLENLQPGGSFKSRAMGNLILHHISNPAYAGRKIHFYASSGGNAGLAAVCAARSLSYPCTVVLPVSTSPLMVQKLRDAGATEVIQHGETIAAAGEYMKNVVMKEDGPGGSQGEDVVKIALHPFDHEAIWEGNSTIVDELAYQLPPADDDNDARALPVDAVICSVGGGGLMNGLVRGIERHRQRQKDSRETNSTKQKDIHILAAETEGTASLALAMSHKALVSLPKITSLATSLGCIRVSAQTLDYALSPPPGVAIHSVVLSDADAARGVLRLVDDERLLVELACGVCVETAVGVVKEQPRGTKRRKRNSEEDEGYGDDRDDDARSRSSRNGTSTADGPSSAASFADSAVASDEDTETIPSRQLSRLKQLVPDLTPESRVVIIVCGGSNVTIDMAWEWRKKLECGWV